MGPDRLLAAMHVSALLHLTLFLCVCVCDGRGSEIHWCDSPHLVQLDCALCVQYVYLARGAHLTPKRLSSGHGGSSGYAMLLSGIGARQSGSALERHDQTQSGAIANRTIGNRMGPGKLEEEG